MQRDPSKPAGNPSADSNDTAEKAHQIASEDIFPQSGSLAGHLDPNTASGSARHHSVCTKQQASFGYLNLYHDQSMPHALVYSMLNPVAPAAQPLLSSDIHTVQLGEHALHIRSTYIPLRSLTAPVPPSTAQGLRVLGKQEACMLLITLLNTSDAHTLFTHLCASCAPFIALTASYLSSELAGLLQVLTLFFLLLEVFPDGFYHILSCDAQPSPSPAYPPAISHVTVSVYFEGTKMVPDSLSELNSEAQRAVDFMVSHPSASVYEACSAMQCSSALVLSVLQRLTPCIAALNGASSSSSEAPTMSIGPSYTSTMSPSTPALLQTSQPSVNAVAAQPREDVLSRELRRCKSKWTFVFDISSGLVSRISILESESIL
ncbi:hypothetical protein EON64_02520 [archaeon]|nr:MAG: hypothetical protein EON64_02520 [archaeon]